MGIDEEWVRQGAGQGVCKLFLLKISKNTTQSVIPYSQPLKTHMDTESLWYIIRENSSWLSLVSPIWNSKGQWISGSLYYTEMRDGQIARQPAHSTPSMDLHRRASPGPQVLVERERAKLKKRSNQRIVCKSFQAFPWSIWWNIKALHVNFFKVRMMIFGQQQTVFMNGG